MPDNSHATGSRAANEPYHRSGFGAVLEAALGLSQAKRVLLDTRYREGIADGLKKALLLWDRWEDDDDAE